jgi:hypothetical protein
MVILNQRVVVEQEFENFLVADSARVGPVVATDTSINLQPLVQHTLTVVWVDPSVDSQMH